MREEKRRAVVNAKSEEKRKKMIRDNSRQFAKAREDSRMSRNPVTVTPCHGASR